MTHLDSRRRVSDSIWAALTPACLITDGGRCAIRATLSPAPRLTISAT